MPSRTRTGHHDLLPAAESRGRVVISLFAPHSLLTWTFGRGTVLWRIWPAVLMHTLFATNMYLGIPNIMLTVLGVVIGFVISYRASSGYDRYWTGRSSWSDVMRNARTFTRLVWFHVPLRLTPKADSNDTIRSAEDVHKVMKEKRKAIDLTIGFVIALKHHLRGELGMYYEDLYDRIRPLHKHDHLKHAPEHIASPFATSSAFALPPDPIIPSINSYGALTPTSRPRTPRRRASSDSDQSSMERQPLLPSTHPTDASVFSKISADLIPFAAFFRRLPGSYRVVDDPYTEEGGVQRRWMGAGAREEHTRHRPRVAGSGENLPLDVLRHLSDWLSVLEERGTVPGSSLGGMIGCIAAFEDGLVTLERILTTPLPFVYSVHISTVWIYLFFLPFQLVDLFGWYTIPGVAIAAFIYLGFLAAGEEIEQPFGYDENDLDLDMFCREIVVRDAEHLMQMPGNNVFLGAHHEGDTIAPNAR